MSAVSSSTSSVVFEQPTVEPAETVPESLATTDTSPPLEFSKSIRQVLAEREQETGVAFTDPELACIATVNAGRTDTSVYEITDMAHWCSPTRRAGVVAQIEPADGGINLATYDERFCYIKTIATYFSDQPFSEYLDLRGSLQLDPESPLRPEIERRLLRVCGIDEAMAVQAGLPRKQGDPSATRIDAFCEAFVDRVRPGPTYEENVAFWTADLEVFRGLDVDEWMQPSIDRYIDFAEDALARSIDGGLTFDELVIDPELRESSGFMQDAVSGLSEHRARYCR